MGSGTSRGKKVAPANVREITVLNRDDNIVHSLNEDKLPLQPVKIPTFSNFTLSQNMAKHDCHSEGHHSEFSADEDEIAEELDRVLSEYERPRGIFSKGTNSPKKSFIRSKTYGFCRRVNHEREFNSSPHLPRLEHFEKESLACIRAGTVDKKNVHQTACPDSALRSVRAHLHNKIVNISIRTT